MITYNEYWQQAIENCVRQSLAMLKRLALNVNGAIVTLSSIASPPAVQMCVIVSLFPVILILVLGLSGALRRSKGDLIYGRWRVTGDECLGI